MLKLLLCLLVALIIGVCVLQLRQQRLELNHQANVLHDQIESRQARLWNQQLQIAVYTAPNAIQKTVGDHDLQLTPVTADGTAAPADWIKDGKTVNESSEN